MAVISVVSRVPMLIARSSPLRQDKPARAIVSHLDTLGAQVKLLKDNGRLEVVPIGHWSARFAEGARVTLFSESRRLRDRRSLGSLGGADVPTRWNHTSCARPIEARRPLVAPPAANALMMRMG